MPPAPGAPSPRIWDRALPDAMAAVMDRLARVRRRTIRGTLHRAIYAKYLLPPGRRS